MCGSVRLARMSVLTSLLSYPTLPPRPCCYLSLKDTYYYTSTIFWQNFSMNECCFSSYPHHNQVQSKPGHFDLAVISTAGNSTWTHLVTETQLHLQHKIAHSRKTEFLKDGYTQLVCYLSNLSATTHLPYLFQCGFLPQCSTSTVCKFVMQCLHSKNFQSSALLSDFPVAGSMCTVAQSKNFQCNAVWKRFPGRWQLTNVVSPPLFTPLPISLLTHHSHTHVIDHDEDHKGHQSHFRRYQIG